MRVQRRPIASMTVHVFMIAGRGKALNRGQIFLCDAASPGLILYGHWSGFHKVKAFAYPFALKGSAFRRKFSPLKSN